MVISFFIISASTHLVVVFAFEVDASGIVTEMKDGDSFVVSGVGGVRLADIDAPEYDKPGGTASKIYLTSLIFGERVYLDISSMSEKDQYGRYVCVAYLHVESKKYLNVNEKLVQEGYAKYDNYLNNEFDPDTWSLYVYEAEAYDEASNVIVVASVGLGIFLIVLIVLILRRS
jgi:endonuclease YncB( thermonuclease family)